VWSFFPGQRPAAKEGTNTVQNGSSQIGPAKEKKGEADTRKREEKTEDLQGSHVAETTSRDQPFEKNKRRIQSEKKKTERRKKEGKSAVGFSKVRYVSWAC